MSRRRKTLFDNLFDRFDDAGRDVRKASRRAFRTKKKKKGGARKWAKRTNQEVEALTEQVGLLVQHLKTQQQPDRSRDEVHS
jgi:hypothetical protein